MSSAPVFFSRNLLYCSKRKQDITGERKLCQNFYQSVSFSVWLLFGILLAGCGNSPSSDEEPPVYSPARVLTPEAPGKKTLGSSPLILDISNQDQGYLTAESDSDDSRMNIQLTAPSGVVYSYFLEPDEQAVLPFSEAPVSISSPAISR